MKRLYIVRHGAAQSSYEVDSDYARRLTAKGGERVRIVGQWLTAQPDFVQPGRIIASAAPRALQTAELLAEVFGLPTENLSRFRELYSGRPSDYLNLLTQALPDEVACAMIVGHNPTVSELLAELLGAMAGDYLMRKGDVAEICFDLPDNAPWQELYAATGKLERYVIASSIQNV